MSSQTFLGSDPGASKYGNFINYYDFHPAKERLDGFPTDVWWVDDRRRRFTCLDIGCNSGELTQALWEFVSSSLKFKPAMTNGEYEDKAQCFEPSHDCDAVCSILGVDLDPTLILRAVEGNLRKDVVHFECCDVMNEAELKQAVGSFFGVQELDSEAKFDAVFLFSVTMWIHLNCGDDGLRKLLLLSAKFAKDLIVIEPQLWKCYSAAKRRCTRAGGDGFPLLPKLTLRSDEAIENEISKILCEAGFKKISEYKAPKWKRKIIIYQSCAVTV